MNPQRQKQWQEILRLTQQMCELAVPNQALNDLSADEESAKQPWQTITEIETQRFKLLQHFFENNPTEDELVEIEDGIRLINESDQKLANIAAQMQNEIAAVFSKNTAAQRAVSAYSDHE